MSETAVRKSLPQCGLLKRRKQMEAVTKRAVKIFQVSIPRVEIQLRAHKKAISVMVSPRGGAGGR